MASTPPHTNVNITSNRQREVLKMGFHENAEEEARKIVDQFSVTLVVQSKLVAYQKKADQVLTTHVEEAHDRIKATDNERGWSKEIAIALGSAFFGAFVPGFITELSANHIPFVVVYTILGMLGIILVAWGLQKH